MTTTYSHDARLNFRLPVELKHDIEEAAALAGLTVSDFAISALAKIARTLQREHDNGVLNKRDRSAFIALLDLAGANPNETLLTAARAMRVVATASATVIVIGKAPEIAATAKATTKKNVSTSV